MDKEKLRSVVECLLFVTNHPLTLSELSDVVGETQETLVNLITEISMEMEKRKSALQVVRVAEGFQFATKEGFSYWVKKLFREQTTFRLSPSALETLSIVAYKQPITRGEIEEIRGVEVTGVLETLIERRLVKVTGRRESIGRPLLYGTTQEFLRHFNLWKISDLPSLEDLAREAERKKIEQAQEAPVTAESGTQENPQQTVEPVQEQPGTQDQPAEPAQAAESSETMTAVENEPKSDPEPENNNGN